MMRCELDLEYRSEGAFANAGGRWFGGALERVLAEPLQALLQGPGLDPAGMRGGVPCGPPDSLWGFCSITTRSQRGLRDTARVISERNLAWFAKTLAVGGHFAADVGISRLGGDGYPRTRLARLTVERVENADQWVRLAFEFPSSSLADAKFRESVLEFVRSQAEVIDPSYGQVGYQYTLGKTALEEVLGPPWLLPEDTVAQSREWLRGYDWVTVCPRELAARLDVTALRAGGDLYEVEPLAGGSLWLRSAVDHADHQGERVHALWSALRPLLRTGVPQSFDARPTDPPFPVVYKDAGPGDAEEGPTESGS